MKFIPILASCLLAFGIWQTGLSQTYTPCANSAPTVPPTATNYNVLKVVAGLHHPIQQSNGNTFSLVSAHRGYWQYAPENSIRSFYAAVAIGAEIIEIDTRETSDGVPMMEHDDDITRTMTGTGAPETNTIAQIQSYYLRDRRGCPTTDTGDTGTSLAQVFAAWGASNMVYYDSQGVLRGTVLIVDIKGKGSATKYQNLKDAISVFNTMSQLYPALADAVVFKAPLKALPDSPAQFQADVNWSAYPNSSQNLIAVLYPEDDNKQSAEAEVAAGGDVKFTAYNSAPYLLHFETAEYFNGDLDTPYRQFLQSINMTVAGYLPENFFPEGEPTGGICCKVGNTLPSTAQSQLPITSTGALNCQQKALNYTCLDYRGRVDFLMSTGMRVFTVERAPDAFALFTQLGLRDLTAIE